MSTQDEPLWARSATELVRLLSRREVSSVEVVRSHLARISEVESEVRAFTEVLGEQALLDAERRDADARAGRTLGPLHGLPISVKECFDLSGRATTLGIPAWRSHRATEDAALVRACVAAGAVVLGRTNLSQTMLFPEARNPLFGQTNNPLSRRHTPGGSSGGEAAAIAAGMSPLGLGTDIGGSIRVPCHFTGITGIKPTLDRLPMRGARTVLVGQEAVRSQAGPMARTVADLELLFAALSGPSLTRFDGRTPPLAWTPSATVALDKLRVGVFSFDGVLAASAACLRAVDRASAILKGRGASLVDFDFDGMPDMVSQYLAAVSADGGKTLVDSMEKGPIDPVLGPLKTMARLPASVRRALSEAAHHLGEERLHRMLRALGEKPVAEYWRLIGGLRGARFRLLDAMEHQGIDVLLMPPSATPAFVHGGSKNFTLSLSYAMLANAAQLPAGVVPITTVQGLDLGGREKGDRVDKLAASTDAESLGLPVGVQVVGRPWEESLVLAVMGALEAETEGSESVRSLPIRHLFPVGA